LIIQNLNNQNLKLQFLNTKKKDAPTSWLSKKPAKGGDYRLFCFPWARFPCLLLVLADLAGLAGLA
jgi:hypothetical protein